MDPVSVLVPVAESIVAFVGEELAAPAVRGVRTRIFGDPEQKALARALARAFATVENDHGRLLAGADVNAGFWVHEGAEELAKVLIPGAVPSGAGLARRAVDSLGPSVSEDDRLDRIVVLRPVFKTLLDELAVEVRSEPDLQAVLGRADAAHVAQAAVRLAEHAGASAAGEDDQVAYLHWLADQHRYLRTAGVVRKTTVQLPLAEVFVGLHARQEKHPGDRARVWFEQERAKLTALVESGRLDQTEFEAALDRLYLQCGRRFDSEDGVDRAQVTPVLDAVRNTAHLLVLGDPGTGKTTLLKYLAFTHALALTAGRLVQGQPARFPIYLRVGDYARQGYPNRGIGEFLPAYLGRLECRTPGLADLLRRELDAGRCLVLLDGLDEIASAELRRGVVAAVTRFVTAHTRQGNRFVVTSRIAGYQAAPLPEPFVAVRLQDMNQDTIDRFLDVYCQQVERAETPDKSEPAILQAGQREAAAIRQALAANAGVRRLAANPLLLTALVLVHRASGRLPHRRVEAYVEVCNALGRTWRSAQGVAEADLPDERILTRWLTELGSWMHQHRAEGAASRLELLRVLGPLWAAHHGTEWDPTVLNAADPLRTDAGLGVAEFVDKADTHTGLLVERAPGRYGFAHLTFEEYYTGRALAFRGTTEQRITAIRSRLHDPRYDEPILLALGLIGTDYTEQVETVVAEAIWPATAAPSPYEDLLGRDFLFMLRVLADDTPLQTATIDTVLHQAITELLTPRTSRCRYRSYRHALSRGLTALIGTKAGERFRTTLDQQATALADTNPAEFIELATIATKLGPPTPHIHTALTTLATTDHAAPSSRARAMEALAQGGALTAPMITALVEIATGDADLSVRMVAVGALAQGGALTAPVITALVEIATGVADQGVRARAVGALARGGPLTAPVITAAVEIATGDADLRVRMEAVGALAQGRAPTAPVITALVEIVKGGADLGVRALAMGMLVGEAPTAPAITALVEIATGHADLSVRMVAMGALAQGGAVTAPMITALVEIATGHADLTVRALAMGALAQGGALTAPVITAAVEIATGDADLSVRALAMGALAQGGALTAPVITALVEIATGDADLSVRARAVGALAQGGALTAPVITAAVEIATGDADLRVRARAVGALAQGGALTAPVITALVEIATGDADLRVRMEAVEALAQGGALTAPVITALVEIATGDADLSVRARAVGALAQGGALTAPVITAAVEIATGDAKPGVRTQAVNVLKQAPPTNKIIEALVSLFADQDQGLRRHAGRTLVELSRQYATHADRIRSALASACTPFLDDDHTTNEQSGMDDAYDALRRQIGDPAPAYP
ncbi:HEAT repeat domain-containing protein [Micromonospora chersina]